MSLTRLFTISTIVLFALVVVMFSRILADEWHGYETSRVGLHAVDAARLALVVAEKASFERGPMNGVLGAAPGDRTKRARLTRARSVTDGAISDLQSALANSPALAHRAEALAASGRVRAMLAAARADADRVAAVPLRERTATELTRVLREMFAVIPVAMESAMALTHDAEEAYPQFSDDLEGARFAADMREYAGRLGSHFTAALALRKPLAPAERLAIAMTRGRLEQLRQLIEQATIAPDTDPRILAAERTMEQRYFGDGLAFVAGVEANGDTGRYAVDTAQFAARYQPPMGSIVRLRDALLATAVDGAQAAHAASRRNLIVIALFGTLSALGVVSVFLLIRWRVVAPLLQATRILVDIAEGKLQTEVPHAGRADEIGDMLRAVVTLKTNTVEKQRLERELQLTVNELRSVSRTDFLTGILNRRAFVEAALIELAGANRYGWPFALILFDADHFKSINDRFGHEVGDDVLMHLTALARTELREGDILARYGGEEFVVFASHCEPEKAAALAERLRAAFNGTPLALADGRTVRATASFGCVTGAGSEPYVLSTLLQAADRALYAAKAAGRNRVVVAAAAPAAQEADR
ncbi:MAG TPA: GGDEF domain-containing protein [Candidatus Elarobacter sp.]